MASLLLAACASPVQGSRAKGANLTLRFLIGAPSADAAGRLVLPSAESIVLNVQDVLTGVFLDPIVVAIPSGASSVPIEIPGLPFGTYLLKAEAREGPAGADGAYAAQGAASATLAFTPQETSAVLVLKPKNPAVVAALALDSGSAVSGSLGSGQFKSWRVPGVSAGDFGFLLAAASDLKLYVQRADGRLSSAAETGSAPRMLVDSLAAGGDLYATLYNTDASAQSYSLSLGTPLHLSVAAGSGGSVALPAGGTAVTFAGLPVPVSVVPPAGNYTVWTETTGTGAAIADPLSPATTVTLSSGPAALEAQFGTWAIYAAANDSAGGIWKSTDFGQNWAMVESLPYACAVAVSDDASKAVALAGQPASTTGDIYHSSDSGSNWTIGSGYSGAKVWSDIASSSDGTMLVAAGYNAGFYIYTSTSSGAAWTQHTMTSSYFTNVASSSDGSRLAAVNSAAGSPTVFTSSDSGANWIARSLGTYGLHNVASSADGLTLLAGTAGSSYRTYLRKSTDGGSSWTSLTNSPSTLDWTSLAMSGDGQIMIAASYGTGAGDYIYVSYDYGANWTARANDALRRWSHVACSQDGSIIAATVDQSTGQGVWLSVNGGTTWKQINSDARIWTGAAVQRL